MIPESPVAVTLPERLALWVERKLQLPSALWWMLYTGVSLVLLIPILWLGLGTAITLLAYCTCGLYSAEGMAPVPTVCGNALVTGVHWGLCCWLVLLHRLRKHSFAEEPYRASCCLWISGSMVFAESTVLMSVFFTALYAWPLLWDVAVAVILLLFILLHRRISQ